MKSLVNGLVLVLILGLVLVLGLVGPGLAQPAPQPTLGPTGPCPAVARFDFDLTSVPDADRISWQIRRGAPGQNFGAATQVDNGGFPELVGSVERDLRAYGPVLDGTRYFFRVRARQGGNFVSDWSEPVVFEQDLSPAGMFTASAGTAPGSLRVDWNLSGGIAGCADRVALRIQKTVGGATVQSVENGVSGSKTFDLTAQGAGDYDVRLHARFGGDGAADAVGRESGPVRVSLAAAPALPELSIDDLEFPEGNSSNAQNAVARLSAPTKQPVTVLVGARPGGTATEGACAAGRDVTFALRTVTIDPGQQQVTIPFTLCGDTANEPDESFTLGLLNPVNATLRDDTGVVTVLNDDAPTPAPPPAPLNVSLRDVILNEGNSNNTQNAIVTLSAPTNQSVRVLIGARPGGTATEGACAAGRDVTFALRTVTLDPGQTELSVPFTICGDTVFENDENFSLGLTGAVNAALGDSIGQVTIRNDDRGVEQATVQPPSLPNLQVTIDERPQFETQLGPLLVHFFTVRNTGAGTASNVQVQSTLPRDVRFVRVEENQFDGCTGGVITDAATGQALVRCSVSSLSAGASRHVRIVGEVAGAIPDSTRVVFGVNVDPQRVVPETSESDNFAFLSTILRLRSDVQTTVRQVSSHGGDLGFIGGICGRDHTIIVVLTVRNLGPFGSRATTMSAAWPDPFLADGASCFETCTVPALGPGQTTDIVFRGALDAALGGTLRATFTVDPAGTLLDPIIANNTTSAVVCE